MKPGRTIIIGDVHGCIRELDDLLKVLDVVPGRDRLLFIGDLINKGPDSAAVLHRFYDLRAESILGNHEYNLLRQARGESRRSRSYHRLREALGKKWDTWLSRFETWPLYVRTSDWTLVHAGLDPGRPLEKTSAETLVTIRTWDKKGRDLQDPKNPPWFDFYGKDHLVVFGHWAALGGVVRPNVIGLDTGCVYGNRLSAVVLPERDVVSVPARKTYVKVRS